MILYPYQPLEDFEKSGGGKAISLKRLQMQGFNVPNFFVFDTQFFFKNISPLQPKIESLLQKNEFSEIQKLIRAMELEIPSSIQFFEEFSVRSSANVEDGSLHSFAGIYQSFIYKSHQPGTWIKECWCGIFTSEHFLYLKEKGIDWKQIKMAVIIQEMIKADYSGILFQANPNGNINEKLIVLGAGDGEGVVNGTAETITLTYDIFEQDFLSVDNISPDILDRLKLLIRKSEKYTDHDHLFFDFEFCLTKENIFFLQARPITTVSHRHEIELFDSSNISENYPGVSSPLTLDNLKRLYSVNLKSLLEYLNIPKSTIEKMSQNLDAPIESFHGRPYYKVSTWYNLLQSMPLFNKFLTSSWDYMLGVKKLQRIDQLPLNFRDQFNILFYALPKILSAFLNPTSKEREYQKKYIKFKDTYFNRDIDSLAYGEILSLYQKAERDYFNFAQIALLNDLIVGLHLKLLHFLSWGEDKLLTHLADKNESLESYQLVKSLNKLAKYLDDDLTLKKQLLNIQYIHEIPDKKFSEMVEEHLNQFGDRTIAEMKLETPSLKENPKTFLQYLSKIKILKHDEEKKKESKKGSFLFCKVSQLYLKSLAFRENSRFNRVRVKNHLRLLLLKCDEHLYAGEVTKERGDIFYFLEKELFRPIEELKKRPPDLEGRRTQFKLDQNLTLPSRFYLNSKFDLNVFSQLNKVSDALKGVGCSPGRIEAECLVLSQAKVDTEIKGKILITKTTDPGWVLLMMQASGVIVENGNILSHAAIVGRELGIPTVIDCKGATTQIESGMRILMDGTSGEVKILD